MRTQDIEAIVKSFIVTEFLPDEDPSQLTGTTRLITTGILDSLATLNVVAFLEQQFAITIHAHETSPEYLDSLDQIVAFVEAKQRESHRKSA